MELIGGFGHMLLYGAGIGAALYTIGCIWCQSSLKETVRRGPAYDRAVALTFDDSPDPIFHTTSPLFPCPEIDNIAIQN
jgi:peptidoglycan/xylan/chitin deacetylase (PgdA/CDA1 family)